MSYCLLETAGLSSKDFSLCLDVYTPRPHIIFVGKKLGDVYDLNDSLVHSLVDLSFGFIKHHQEKYAFKQPLLAFHKGTWMSDNKYSINRLHVHICTDSDSYLKFFHDHKRLLGEWPNPNFVNEEWKEDRDPNRYDVNVRGYPQHNYVPAEAKKIAERIKESEEIPDPELTHYKEFKLDFHPKAARIGFQMTRAPSTSKEWANLIMAMQEFAVEYRMAEDGPDADGDDGGSHLCIPLDGSVCNGFSAHVYGYIQMSGWNMYRLCPPSTREEWRKSFLDAKIATAT